MDQSEERLEARRATIRESVARHKARMKGLTRLEQASWKGRDRLGEDYDPYTEDERAAVERIRRMSEAVEREAADLHSRLRERLGAEMASRPELSVLVDALDGAGTKLGMPPY